MPFVPVPETAEAEIRMLLDGQKIENTLYFQRDGGWSPSSFVALANALLLWWTTDYSVFVSSSVTLSEVYLTDLSSSTGIVLSAPAPTPHPAGARSAASLPNNVTICVSFRTGTRGRSFRGRNYISGLSEDAVVLNTVDSAVQADIIAAYDLLQPLAGDVDASWVVASRFSGVDVDGHPIPRTTGIATIISTVIIVDSIIDSQRRRLPGRGQ